MERLQPFVGSGKKVRLTRAIPHEAWHNGFVFALGQEWVLLQQLHDFYVEGYTTIRLADISDIRSGEHERYWERILAGEGILDQIRPPCDVPLDDVASLLEFFQQRGDNVIVECEDRDENLEDFYIGRILSVDNESISFANFDTLGRWDDDPHTVSLQEISKVQFDTPYLKTFSKYLEGPCPHLNRG